MSPLQYHKMLVAPYVQQHDHRDIDVSQVLGRDAIPPGAHADALDVVLHVQHRKALGTHQVFVGIDQHAFDDVVFIHVQPISLTQNGGQRGGTAAEIGFLLHQIAEATFANALYRLEHQVPARQRRNRHTGRLHLAGQA